PTSSTGDARHARADGICEAAAMIDPVHVWCDRPLAAAARVGVLVGILFGIFRLPETGSLVQAMGAGVLFGAATTGVLAWSMRRQTTRSALARDDRVAVARAVRRGERVPDARLAGAVVDCVAFVRGAQAFEARVRGMPAFLATASLVGAVISTVKGATASAVI